MDTKSAIMERKLLFQPNWHTDVYRTLELPPNTGKLEKFLDFIDVSEDGNVLLGSSNLTGRYWIGSIWLFKDTESIDKLENCVAKKTHICGVTDGKFLGSKTELIVADDVGMISVMSLQNETGDGNELSVVKYSNEHDDGITEIAVSPCNKHFVTSCRDGCIKVWDVENMKQGYEKIILDSTHTYSFAHRDVVTSVTMSYLDREVFASCSLDRDAVLWDTRIDVPATRIYRNEFCGLTRAAWHPTQSHSVAVGSERGDLYLLDIREPNEFICKLRCFECPVFRLKFNDGSLLAACADDSKVKILDCTPEEMQLVYQDDSHEDMVRGLAWKNPAHLLSCAWDRSVFHHYV